MAEEYPVIIENKTMGKLRVLRQGSKTVFDVCCHGIGGVIRLSVYGEGKEGYLGVLQPDKGVLRLRRILSPADMRSFPQKIEFAGVKGMKVSAESITLWRSDGLGVLYAEENGAVLCAVQKSLGIAYQGTELPEREIDGIKYRIFEIGKKSN